jgi:hypothetical protein
MAIQNDGIPVGALATNRFNDGIPVGVADQAVTSWLQSNPGASDATIAAAMQQYGVDPAQMARVTGLDTGAVQARYNAALPSAAASTAVSAPNYEQLVRDAYGSIGRTGIGTAASNIDEGGFTNWVNALQSGSIKPEDLTSTFRSSVADYLTQNPTDQYSTYVTNFLADTKPAAVSGIVDLYRDVLGRDPDAGGLGNWYKQFGEEISPEERATFEQSAAAEKYGSIPDSIYSTYKEIYGVEPDAGTLAQLTNRFGPTFDANEVRQLVYDDTSLRDDPRGVVKTLQQQILDQGFTSKWSGEGFGSAQANAADMARMLATAGITDINQFGKINVADDAAVYPVYEQKLVQHPEGDYMTSVISGYVDANGKAVDSNLVRAYGNEDGSPVYLAPVGTKEVYGNKETGVALDPRYDKASKNNAWSGTFAGDGSTAYKVHFQPDGTPVFYTQYGGSSNDLAQIMEDPIIGAAIQYAASYFGGPVGVAAVNLLAGREPEDVAKAALTSWVAGQVGSTVSGSESLVNTVGQNAANVIGNVAGSVVTGGGAEGAVQALIAGGINAAVPEIQTMIPGYADLSPAAKTFVNNAIASTLQDGKLSPQELVQAAVRAGVTASKTPPGSTTGGITNRIVDDAIAQGDGTTNVLADAGLEEVNLPGGIQTASLDNSVLSGIEVTGTPIFAEDSRAASIRPPTGYRVLARSEQDERLISEGVGDAPSKYEIVRPAGSYYDRTLNAWLAPSGEFEAATNVEDFSKYFGGSSLSDADVADIYRGVQTGGVTADDLYWLTGQSGEPLSAADIQNIVSGIRSSGGTPADDMGEMVVTATRPPADDMGEMVITAPRPPADDMGEMVITAPRETLPVEPVPEEEFPEMVVTAPRDPVVPEVVTPPTTPPVKPTTTPPTTPPKVPTKVVRQVARQLGVPATSQIAMDVAEALYGTMEYLDISEEFEPSERKASPAATQKQRQQTKMAQGGYLDAALAEEMSVDELLNLLR